MRLFTTCFAFFTAALLIGCSKDIKVKLPEPRELIVVQGHIEQNAPPWVVLTRNTDVFSGTTQEDIEELFVSGAQVTVSDETKSVQLKEYSSADLPPEILNSFDTEIPEGFDFRFYTIDQSDFFYGKTGKTYQLRVIVENDTLTAQTKIPKPAGLVKLWFTDHPDPDNDSLLLLRTLYNDPDTAGDYARYFSQRNSEPFYSNYFQSVYDDNLINGQLFEFVIERGMSKAVDSVDFDIYGYFKKGDTVIIRWCSIDKAHFDFWNTVDQQRGSAGNPFASPTLIKSNIEGGLGIWGGYGVWTSDILYAPVD